MLLIGWFGQSCLHRRALRLSSVMMMFLYDISCSLTPTYIIWVLDQGAELTCLNPLTGRLLWLCHKELPIRSHGFHMATTHFSVDSFKSSSTCKQWIVLLHHCSNWTEARSFFFFFFLWVPFPSWEKWLQVSISRKVYWGWL